MVLARRSKQAQSNISGSVRSTLYRGLGKALIFGYYSKDEGFGIDGAVSDVDGLSHERAVDDGVFKGSAGLAVEHAIGVESLKKAFENPRSSDSAFIALGHMALSRRYETHRLDYL